MISCATETDYRKAYAVPSRLVRHPGSALVKLSSHSADKWRSVVKITSMRVASDRELNRGPGLSRWSREPLGNYIELLHGNRERAGAVQDRDYDDLVPVHRKRKPVADLLVHAALVVSADAESVRWPRSLK